jgi:hypothetical protein
VTAPAPLPATGPAPAAASAAEAKTVLAIPTAPPLAPEPARAAEPAVGRRPRSPWAVGAGLLLVALALLALVAFLAWIGGSSRPGIVGPGASPVGSTASPSVGATAPASPLASPVATATLAPSTSADPLAAARAAVRDVQVAIAAAKGGRDGLKGKEANDLDAIVNSVQQALDDGTLRDAAKRSDELVHRVEDLIRRRAVTGQQADQLLAAARALRDALGSG